ncbi:hypothetical protein EJ08DRAFT_732862 [Tothia fuscella]|uniref:Transmembrane protein n=1 Tax=Tothia fuscella TaxID=1048955 RepID=A0A9P4NV02_9PEZI|nr:hypothetical protein EJ08DRAFT_732862 [Tothia fuscella]
MVVELPYSLHGRYSAIAIAWTFIIIPPIFLNLGLFYGLWYGTNVDRVASLPAPKGTHDVYLAKTTLVLTIPTAVLGIFTIIAIIERVYKLTQPSPQFRPLKSPRYGLDVFQWGYFAALLIISALISSTLARDDTDHDGHELQIRLVSMPASVLMYFLAILNGLSLILNALEVTLPFQFGSSDAGTVVRPAIYYVVEDVVAVDGNGGVAYREAFGARYRSSPIFQRMIWTLSVVWMVAFFVMASALTILVFTLPKAAVYAVGWAAPFLLAGLLAIWTIFYVKAALKKERAKIEDGYEAHEPINGRNWRNSISPDNERTPLLERGG